MSKSEEQVVMNFTRPVFLVRANLVFVGIRYKHLGYKTSKASPSYTAEPKQPPVCASRSSPQKALSARTYIRVPILDRLWGAISDPRRHVTESALCFVSPSKKALILAC